MQPAEYLQVIVKQRVIVISLSECGRVWWTHAFMCPPCEEKLESCVCCSHQRWGKQNNQQLLPSNTVDRMSFWRGFCTARRGEELLLGALASHDPFWSIFGISALAGKQPCSGACMIITPLSTLQRKSHCHICANSSKQQQNIQDRSPLFRTRTEPSLQHTSYNHLLICSLGSIHISLKERY